MGKHSRLWQQHERRTAEALGAERVGNSGRATSDARSKWLSIECKTRKALPAWLQYGMRQAEAGAGETRLPVLVLHQEGERAGRDLVCMRRDDFAAWFGELRIGQGEHDDATQTESA
jgi:hypothetical protein